MSEKTHWKKYFDYNYLGVYSLEDYPSEPILTIKNFIKEKVKDQNGKEEECLVCHWVEKEKPMIFNKTNCKVMEALFKSPHVEDWSGKRVQIYAAKVRAFGQETDGLRIRNFIPKSQKEQSASSVKAEIRSLLAAYNGQDKEEIKQKLNETVSGGFDTPEFYEEIKSKLKQ